MELRQQPDDSQQHGLFSFWLVWRLWIQRNWARAQRFIAGYVLQWCTQAWNPTTADTRITRNSAGVLEINNGTAGTLRDLAARDIAARSVGFSNGSGWWGVVSSYDPGNTDRPAVVLQNAISNAFNPANASLHWIGMSAQGPELTLGRGQGVITSNIVTSATPSTSVRLCGGSGSGTNIAGTSLHLAGGRSTGTGLGGSVVIQTAPSSTTGSTLNALIDRIRIDSNGNTDFLDSVGSLYLRVSSGFGVHAGVTPIHFAASPVTMPDAAIRRSGTALIDVRADNGLRIRNFADSADAALTCGALQWQPRQSSLDPTTSDIPSGRRVSWYNSTTNEFRDWVNMGGVLLKSAAYT